MSDYTKDQETIVLKILNIEKSDYYKILAIEKSASDTDIKKSYRKLAIKLHPDKNKHPKSSEAFKKLAKAFEVLSDADKKRIYDQTGVDPDARGGGSGSSSGFSGFSNSANAYQRGAGSPFSAFQAGGGRAFDQDDILNFMFGGGGGSPFTTFTDGNGFSFQFGGPGFSGSPFSAFQQAQQRQHQQQRQQQQRRATEPTDPVERFKETIKALLPILLFLLVPLISSFFGGDDTTSATGSRLPKFSFDPQPALPIERVTTKYKIPYYINEKTFTNNGGYQDPQSPKLRTLDKRVENAYINDLKYKCHNENLRKQDAIEDSTFFFFVNEKKLAEANAMVTPSCDRLSDLGLL